MHALLYAFGSGEYTVCFPQPGLISTYIFHVFEPLVFLTCSRCYRSRMLYEGRKCFHRCLSCCPEGRECKFDSHIITLQSMIILTLGNGQQPHAPLSIRQHVEPSEQEYSPPGQGISFTCSLAAIFSIKGNLFSPGTQVPCATSQVYPFGQQ